MALSNKDIHIFLEHNLPEYQRRDLVEVCKFYLRTRKVKDKNPLKTTLSRIQDFKKFICHDWQGVEINTSRAPLKKKVVPEFGSCSCGGIFTIRTNRKTGDNFLGCSRYPKCTQTKEL